MTLLLRALAALTKDIGLITRTHYGSIPSIGDPMPFFWPPQVPGTPDIHAGKRFIHIKQKLIRDKKEEEKEDNKRIQIVRE